MSLKNVTKNTEVEEKLTALDTNVAAVQAIARAVEGTIGPKGLDTMLVDRFGEVVITNDGVTILNLMEVNHPAAKMLINAARSQEEEIGDGTTTATILASALVTSGAERVKRGVPVARIVEGLSIGVRRAVEFWEQNCWPVVDLEDSILRQVALVAGRGYEDISELVIRAARLVGKSVLLDPSFRLRDCVCAAIGAENDVFSGVVINKQRMNEEMPEEISSAKIVIIDDALEPEELEDGALGTEAGFARFLDLRREFEANLSRLISCGVNVVLVDRGVSEIAEEILTEAGVMVVQRVSRKQMRKVAEHTGAKPIKRTGLKKSAEALERCLGRAERVVSDEKLEQVRILGGKGRPLATILVGAATEEVLGERERIARDAAAAVQAAVRGGVVPGGGTAELGAAQVVEKARAELPGMVGYGVDCVAEALRRPFYHIVANAGFNPLEKIGDVTARQMESGDFAWGIDCNTGELCNMRDAGVIDPVLVKLYALKTATEVARAILRIDTIIKKKEEQRDRQADGRILGS